MVIHKEQQKKFRELLRSAVTNLCRQGLGTNVGFSIEALIGITLEDGEIMLVSISETMDDGISSPGEESVPSCVTDSPVSPQKQSLRAHSLRIRDKRKRGRPREVTENTKDEKQTPVDKVGYSTLQSMERKDEGTDDKMPASGKYSETDGSSKDYTENQIKKCNTADKRVESPKASSQRADTSIPHVGPYKCEECSAVYIYRKCLVEHYSKAHQTLQNQITKCHEWPCQGCDRVFQTKRSLARHVVVHAEDRQRHRCHKCAKTFSCKRHVNFHISTIHQGCYPFVCELCGKQVTTRAALEGHMASKHSINRLKCQKCNREYARPAALASHICTENSHSQQETVCQICQKSFDLPKQLVQHMAKHQEPRFQCEHCGRNFKWLSSLKAHKAAAHSVDESSMSQQQQQQQQQQQLPPPSLQQQLPLQEVPSDQHLLHSKHNTVVSTNLLEAVPGQAKESGQQPLVAVSNLSLFGESNGLHPLQHQPTKLPQSEQLVSVMPSILTEASGQNSTESVFFQRQHATEVTSGGSLCHLSDLTSSTNTDMNQAHAAWHMPFISQTKSTTMQIQPSAQ